MKGKGRLAGRLLSAVAVLLAVYTVTFFLMRLAPGGPFDSNAGMPPEVRANLERKFGLDRPVAEQYVRTLAGYLAGDFGPSLSFAPGRSVGDLLGATLPVSMELGCLALLLAMLAGGIGGAAAGRRPGSAADRVATLLALAVISASVITVGALLRKLLCGPGSPFVLGGFDSWRNKLPPALALGLAYAAIFQRLVRANVAARVADGTARAIAARGVPQGRAFFRYLLPAALVPMLDYMGPAVAGILTGSFVVESIFEVPGVAACLVQGAAARDYTLVSAAILVYTALLVGLNLLFETAHEILDPRLRRVRSRIGGGGP